MKLMVPVSTRYLNKKKKKTEARTKENTVLANIFDFSYKTLTIHVHNCKVENAYNEVLKQAC